VGVEASTVSGLGEETWDSDWDFVLMHPAIGLLIIQHPITQAMNCLLLQLKFI
jgi:hypothetical protein